MTKYSKHVLPAMLLALALPMAAQADANANGAAVKQVAIATAHAGMAMGAADLATARAHLHHVVNCLVGPSGKDFDAKAEDPCKGMGHGAITDSNGDVAAVDRLNVALGQAKHGLQATTLDAAHADAKQVMQTLQTK
ncbi:hypothetical protein [Rhodanobacter sp. DHG33]|uniref:hypothetical protein n=1 Tax=Rhodanobacter sp. DHG33 TaxID=2775921 RepID=UPI00178481FF|nr:hypothetical protein [Rhodanobacter sp. DHG33]MBD8899669.1 hypothetical protein [Rhodanobacter sp. DHG33]